MKGSCLFMGVILTMMLPTWCQAGVSPRLDGMGSFGVSLGVMQWLADSDAREFDGDEYGDGGTAQIRPIGKMVFRYRFSGIWVLSVETGYGWNSYPDSDDLVLSVIPATVGLERRIGEISAATASLCFGAGVYVWAQRRGGEFLIDAETYKDYHAADPGAYAGLAGEFHVSDHVTVMTQLTGNFIYSAHSNDFKDRLGGDHVFVDLRIGVNCYFCTSRGLSPEGAEEK